MSISKPTDGMGVFCTRCNAEMDPDATFCPNCGEPRLLHDPTDVIEEVVEEPAPVVVEEKRGFPTWASALIGVLATLIIVLVVVLFATSNDDNGSPTTTTVPTVPTTPATAPAPSPPQVIVVPPPATSPPATSPPTTNPPATTAPTTAAP